MTTPGAPEREAIRSMFDEIAPRYDFLNRVLSVGIDARWRRRAVDRLQLPQGGLVLDVCTGTAELLLEAIAGGQGRRGIGVDIAAGMLEIGQGKLRERRLGDLAALVQGDALRLPVASDRFDGAMVAFGIRNTASHIEALREMVRALRVGGRLVVLEFAMPRGPLGRAYRYYFTRILPILGGLVSGNRGAYVYLPASVGKFPPPAEFAALMRDAGLGEVASLSLTGGIAYIHSGVKRA